VRPLKLSLSLKREENHIGLRLNYGNVMFSGMSTFGGNTCAAQGLSNVDGRSSASGIPTKQKNFSISSIL
jgi:hypothetical protein